MLRFLFLSAFLLGPLVISHHHNHVSYHYSRSKDPDPSLTLFHDSYLASLIAYSCSLLIGVLHPVVFHLLYDADALDVVPIFRW